jgi:DNA-binding transcriptional LysR family regulator
VALTEAGTVFVEAAMPVLAELQGAWEQIRAKKTGASGLLRINTSRITLSWVLAPVIAAMAERYPDLTVELYFDDGLTDIVGAGFDVGVRIGTMVAETWSPCVSRGRFASSSSARLPI